MPVRVFSIDKNAFQKKEKDDDRTQIQVPRFPIPAKSGIRGNFEWRFKLIGEREFRVPGQIGNRLSLRLSQGEWESIRDFAAGGSKAWGVSKKPTCSGAICLQVFWRAYLSTKQP
jgi:hypothetical protein